MSNENDYDTWLTLVATHGKPAANSDVGAGFWRLPSSKGHARPVATWYEDNRWWVSREGLDTFDSVDKRGAFLKFKDLGWPALEAVTEADYEKAIDTGVWPDNVPAQPNGAGHKASIAPEAPVGHNEPPDDATLDALIAKLDALTAEATKMAKAGEATSKEAADSASNLKARIRALRQEIIASHKVAKAPALEEGRRIDALYFKPRDKAINLEDRLHTVVLVPWLKAEQQRRDEERARIAAEKAAGKEAAMPDAKVRAGATGMTTSLRTRWVGTIEDYDAFYEGVKEHDEVRRFMIDYAQKIASNIHKIGATIPGLTTSEEKY